MRSVGSDDQVVICLMCLTAPLTHGTKESHCLQSSEQQGVAQLEGYGHYFAGNIWNTRSDAQCVFTYYKNTKLPDGGLDEPPPLAKSSTQAVRWAETYCPRTERSTEYDWMGFYTAIARATAGPIPTADLRRVYGRLCTGSPTGTCAPTATTPKPTWTNLDLAARAEFAQGSPKYVNFSGSGDAYGVTR
jgi:hypothetical protein